MWTNWILYRIGKDGYFKKFTNYIILYIYIYIYIKLVLVGGTEKVVIYNFFFFKKIIKYIIYIYIYKCPTAGLKKNY